MKVREGNRELICCLCHKIASVFVCGNKILIAEVFVLNEFYRLCYPATLELNRPSVLFRNPHRTSLHVQDNSRETLFQFIPPVRR
jgi:hypothetical protein